VVAAGRARELGPTGLRGRLGPPTASTQRFVTTARYEWMFWDMGYPQESWPL
jgi:hypothetical protein